VFSPLTESGIIIIPRFKTPGATPSSKDSMLLAAELLQRAAWADIIE